MSGRATALVICFAAAAAITLGDWGSRPGAFLAPLYTFPLVVSAFYFSWKEVMAAAVALALLSASAGPAFGAPDFATTFLIAAVWFGAVGGLTAEIVRLRNVAAYCARKLQEAGALRRGAEEEAHVVIETSPAAILTINSDGTIDLGNQAARRLLCLGSGTIHGQNVGDYFPIMNEMLKSPRSPSFLCAMVEAQGRRSNGDMFFCHMWLSSYSTPTGSKFAAVVGDVSEQVRDREELGLRQLLINSHIIANAVSHEIRNLAVAAAALHEDIARSCAVTESANFRALGHLIQGMRKLCSSEIPADTSPGLRGVDLKALLNELEILVRTGSEENEVEFRWNIAENLPPVYAHHAGLLQVFLNLTKNSIRALRGLEDPKVTIAAYPIGGAVIVAVTDNGPGIASPDLLFQPFQPGAASSGLGLYVSRAIVRSYGGELRYARRSLESCFELELQMIAATETAVA